MEETQRPPMFDACHITARRAAGFGAEFPCSRGKYSGRSPVTQRCSGAMRVSDDSENLRILVSHLLVPQRQKNQSVLFNSITF